VRVRVLLDDLHKVGKDDVLRALDGHPHIEIRVFNPFHERTSSMWGMGKQFAGDFARLNRRMHNKTFIVDGTAAVIGGRNIGDEYFDAHGDVNFRDLDVMLIGPVVPEIARSFDTYWNSEPSTPVDAFRHDALSPTQLATVRTALTDNANAMRESKYGVGVIAEAGELTRSGAAGQWAWGSAEFLADDPGKVTPDVDSRDLHMAPHIRQWLDTAQHRILLVSPYFVPGDTGVAYLKEKRSEHIEVAVLTNSLASTDADNVYAAYASYRPALLSAGVELYELKPDAARSAKQSRLLAATSSQSSLHSKVMMVDDDKAFVGSMNLDPRSGNLNTECGVIMTSPAFAGALVDIFEGATNPEFTYEVKLRTPGSNRVYWETTENGETVLYDDAPRTSAWRRMKASMTRMLPIEGLL
jgi:putative cardiolipin synthase